MIPMPSQSRISQPQYTAVATKSDDQRLPVRWFETRQRVDYDAEYVSIGSMPGLIRDSFKDDETIRKLLCDSVVLSRRSRETEEVDERVRLVSALFMKLLQRGRMPLPTLEIERSAIHAFGLDEHTTDLSVNGDVELGWESKTGKRYNINPDQFVARLSERCNFELEAEFQEPLLDSAYELDFITRWVPQNLGDDAGHWITPQASLDTLIESSQEEIHTSGVGRRVDFLFYAPGRKPFVLEIDGPEHQNAAQTDRQRDRSLGRATSMEVIRVTNHEVTPVPSAKLEQIKRRFRVADQTDIEALDSDEVSGHARFADFARACAVASKIQFVMAKAVERGWLTSNEWNLDISGGGPAVAAAVLNALQMYAAYDVLYSGKSCPDLCRLRTDDGTVHAWLFDEGEWIAREDTEFDEPHLSILVEPDSSPYNKLARRDVDFIVRPAFLPVEFSVDLHSNFSRKPIEAETLEVAEPALTFFLQNVFRKRNFREGQKIAIWRTLRQEDTIVLLPTGGGKSIIYQLAGLLMPGITLVIDPIVALIEDQVEGLERYGIERVTGISSALNQAERQAVLQRAERGEFQFILMAPERLQSPEFRGTVGTLRSSSLINLAVIDEAHCVSEWGHEFRPAYLRLADTLRNICQDMRGTAPPLLALTGTASRAVLRDMMIELGIDQSQSDNVVRPDSFDRKELKFEIRRERTLRTGMDALRGVVQTVPQRFSQSPTRFFNPRGRETSSGIVFIRTVNTRDWGLNATTQAVSNATRAGVTTYSGGTVPQGYDRKEWERIKRQNARKFKDNEIPILVATKAFGMGIDKPNIRYVIHNGMPGSIESYYQEAGRAGRDGKTAWCIAVTSEFEIDRTNALLEPDADVEDIRALYGENESDWDRKDDISTALFFHLKSFNGIENELRQVAVVLSKLGDLAKRNRVQLTYKSETEQQRLEYAIVRLVRIGVVEDYELDWNQKQILVDVPRFDFEGSKNKIIEYVKLAQPNNSKESVDRIETISAQTPVELAMALASELIKFTYHVIERSRRSAIRETVNLVRNAKTDENIRNRILEYLQEGVNGERIQELLLNTQDDFDGWWELIEKMQAAVDGGELRGLSIRALESYPDDPGLLFARAASEAMCSDRDDRVCWTTFTYAVQAEINSQKRTRNTAKLIVSLYEFGETRGDVVCSLLTMGLLALESSREEYKLFRLQAYEYARDSQHPETAIAASTFALNEAVERTADMVNRWRNRYSNKCLQLLGVTKG